MKDSGSGEISGADRDIIFTGVGHECSAAVRDVVQLKIVMRVSGNVPYMCCLLIHVVECDLPVAELRREA